jgi:hypothetical protein
MRVRKRSLTTAHTLFLDGFSGPLWSAASIELARLVAKFVLQVDLGPS